MPDTYEFASPEPDTYGSFFPGLEFILGDDPLGRSFSIAFLVFAVVSLALLYHWIRYTRGIFRPFLTLVIYGAGSAALLLLSYIALHLARV